MTLFESLLFGHRELGIQINKLIFFLLGIRTQTERDLIVSQNMKDQHRQRKDLAYRKQYLKTHNLDNFVYYRSDSRTVLAKYEPVKSGAFKTTS